jgi:benzoyl-CoA reductase subunit D
VQTKKIITAGIDAGSRETKAVLLGDGRVLARSPARGGGGMAVPAREVYADLLALAGIAHGEVAHVTATGVGRANIDFASSRITDLTACAAAGAFLYPGVETLIEVGAEESRVLRTDGRGRVLDSAASDKCASGSGAFLDAMARALSMSLEEFAGAGLRSTGKIEMNSQCAVFAESEVVGMIHKNIPLEDISRAVHNSIAVRVSAMAKRTGVWDRAVFVGGMALNPTFRLCLAESLGVELLVPEFPAHADSLGAALIALSHVRAAS